MAPTDQQLLLRLATQAIARRLSEAAPNNPGDGLAPSLVGTALEVRRATFVTLRRNGRLRGCCGSIRAFEPLAQNVVRSALTAAFSDRRFPAVEFDELDDLDLHISILSAPEPLEFFTEADLIARLRPHVDGVILIERELNRQGVFLPAVWEQLPDPGDFVRRLKLKAQLAEDYWSPWMAASRFTAESVHGRMADWLPPGA